MDEAAKRLADRVRDRKVGSIRVVEVQPRIDEDAEGNRAVFLDLTLSDPPEGEETWPVDDILELYREIDEEATELELTLPWYVTLQKQTPEEQETDEGESKHS